MSTGDESRRKEMSLHAVESGLARQIRGAIAHRRRIYGHTLKDTRSAFAAMDRNGNGRLEEPEFRGGLTRLGLGLSHDEVDQLVAAMGGGDGAEIEYDGFVRALHAPHEKHGGRQPDHEPEPEQAEAGHGQGGLAAAALLLGGKKPPAPKPAPAPAPPPSAKPTRESRAEQWLNDAKKLTAGPEPKGAASFSKMFGVPSRRGGGKKKSEARKANLPRIHGVEVEEIVESCGLNEAGGQLYLDAFQVLVDASKLGQQKR